MIRRASPLVPEEQLDPAILVVPFSSVAVRPEEVSKVSEEAEVQRLRHQWLDHVLPRAVPFLLSDVQEVHEPDMVGFRSNMAKITCLRSPSRFTRFVG